MSKYIGNHAYTPEYAFQEKLRKNDLGIRNLMEAEMGAQKAELFFTKGWSQLIGALIALKSQEISHDFHDVIEQNIQDAIEKGKLTKNPFATVNVRQQAKNIMMYPHANKYFPWQKISIDHEPIVLLNNLSKNYPLTFVVRNGQGQLQVGDTHQQTLFNSLWDLGFEQILQKHHYSDFKVSKLHPHITLINTNIIADLKDRFVEKYGSSGESTFEEFIQTWLKSANIVLKEEKTPIEFTHFDSTYSEDYSPNQEVIVALEINRHKNGASVISKKSKRSG